ncbi:MAG: HYR domain-containing protein, partial [Lentimicrobiaceae bacterium]
SGYYQAGETTIIWTAVDECGNTSTDQTIVTVEDMEDPTIICPQHITIAADQGVCEAFINVPQPVVSDNCEIREVTNTFNHTDDATGVYPVGTTVVWWTVVDMNGNSANCFMNVTVVDEQDPTIICPDDITVNTDPGVCEAQVNVPLPEVDDNCGINTLVNSFNGTGDASGIYPVGTTTVTWTVTDLSNNTATCTMIITVVDNELPTIICPEAIAQNTDLGVCGANITMPQPEVADNCGVESVVNDFNGTPDASGFYPVGTTTVVWTVTDIHGNTATCTTTVTITDNELPTIICPEAITQNTDLGVCGANVTMPQPEVADNCGVESVVNDFNSTPDASGFYPVGTTTVVWTVTDIHGNTATCTTTVTIADSELPTIICPENADAIAGEDCTATITIPEPVVSDNCGVESFINDFNSTSNASGTYPIGTTEVTWTVTDIHGNTSTCTMLVHVIAPPMAVDDYATTPLNTPVTVPVLNNDTDCDSNIVPSTVTVITDPAHGFTMIDPLTGDIIYTPNADFAGTDTFVYSVCDADNLCDEATVTIVIEPAVLVLDAIDDEYSTLVNTSLTITNLENDIYPASVVPKVTILNQPLHGTLSVVQSDMTVVYTPDTDYTGTDVYRYILSDMNEKAVADTAITTITIVPDPARDTLIIYNVITPNGDGHNDTWVIDGIEEYPDNEILLFNRWGDQIRQFENYDNQTVVWDGTNKSGDKMSAATYYYIIKLRSIDKVYTGWVIIHAQ